jgi:glutamate dehydrogenase
MPASYFRQVPEKFRNDHIKAISAVKDANMDLYLNLKSHLSDGRQVLTFARPGTQPGTLLKMVEELPWKFENDLPLTRILVFSSNDESLSLNMFVYGNKVHPAHGPDNTAGTVILEYAARVNNGDVPGVDPSPLYEPASMKEFLSKCSDNYINAVAKNDPRRFLLQRQLFQQVYGTEGTRVNIEQAKAQDGIGNYWVDVAVANSLPQVALEHLCRLLFHHHFDVARSRLDVVQDDDNQSVTMLRMLVTPVNEANQGTFETLSRELKRAKWLDPATMDLVFEKYPHLGIARAEVITAFCSMMHPIMAKENAIAFSKANIYDTITSQRFISFSTTIADLFLDRFRPTGPLSDEDYAAAKADIRKSIETDVEDTIAADLLYKMIDIIDHTLKTNAFMVDRYALGLRLDPAIMENADREMPYGILFVHGRRFNGYHVRFRDIARGGLRLVTPRSQELYALESARQYDECYGLAYAQQLKNKDIPEGGSKAVCLINNVGVAESGKNFVMRKSVKAFTDCILDLIVKTDETDANIVDRFGKKEVLYLGPDEQVIPEDIKYVCRPKMGNMPLSLQLTFFFYSTAGSLSEPVIEGTTRPQHS